MSQKKPTMKIFGFPPIAHPDFKQIFSIEDVKNSNANEVLFFKDTLTHCLELGAFLQKNNTNYAVEITSVQNFLFFSNLGAKYALVRTLASTYQNLAKEYMLDILVLQIINQQEEILTVSAEGIDGVIFENLLL